MLLRLACVLTLSTALTSAQNSADVLRRFQWNEAAGRLRGPAAKEAAAALLECSGFAAELQQAKAFPPEYLRSLASSAAEANQVLHNDVIGREQAAELLAIALDLKLKAAAFQQDRRLAEPFRKVAVVAHTKDAAGERSGFEVWWAFFSDRKNASAYTKLPKDSSPASGDLYPGLYVMYARKGDLRGSPTAVSVDSRGKTPVDFDLPIH